MNGPITALGRVPDGRRVEGETDRPAGVFGTLRRASAELCQALRKNGVREIPDAQLARSPGGRYWADLETGKALELVRSWVDPANPSHAGCIAYAVRDGYIVPFKARDDEGPITSVSLGSVGGSHATGRERIA